jgi:hypothetical protein
MFANRVGRGDISGGDVIVFIDSKIAGVVEWAGRDGRGENQVIGNVGEQFNSNSQTPMTNQKT